MRTAATVVLCTALVAGCQTAHLDYAPPPGYVPKVPVTVAEVPSDQLADVCALSPDRLVGCSRLWPDHCEIYLAAGLPPALRRETLRHERAHCGGWSHPEDQVPQTGLGQ